MKMTIVVIKKGLDPPEFDGKNENFLKNLFLMLLWKGKGVCPQRNTTAMQ